MVVDLDDIGASAQEKAEKPEGNGSPGQHVTEKEEMVAPLLHDEIRQLQGGMRREPKQ